MKTILAILFAGGLLVRAQQPPATNSAAPAFPALPPASIAIPTNLDEATRTRLNEMLLQRAARLTNAAPAAAIPAPQLPLPGLPVAPAAQPVAGPGNVLVPPPGAAVPGAAPAPAAVAPANPGVLPVPVVQSGAPAAEATEFFKYSYPGGVDFDILLGDYEALVERTIIRPTALPAGKMVLATHSPLTRAEAIQAFEIIFTMNGISTIPWGEKFMKVVPSQQVKIEAKDFAMLDATNVPPTGQYIAQIVHLKYARPSEVMPVILPYSRLQDVQAIDSSMILVIRDVAENIKRMMEVIDLLDVTAASGTVEPEIIPIKYALAEDIQAVLTSLTGGGGGGTTVGRAAGAATGGARVGARRGGINSSSSSAYGAGGLQGGGVGGLGGARVGGAAPAAGATFAQRLNDIVNRVGGDFEVLGQVKIIADARTNSLLIFAGNDDMKMIKKIVDKLDVVLAQVLIEAIVLEVALDDSLDYGVSAVQKRKSLTDRITGGGGWNNGQFFNAFTNGLGLPEGSSYAASIGQTWDVAVQAIAKDSTINVLSRPRIQTSHAKQASLFVGDTVPYVTSSYYGGFSGTGQNSSQYTQRDIGIQIDVMPLINPDGLVIMDIQQVNIEQLGVPTQIDGNSVPTTSKRSATANVAVRDGETIILGGFISSTRSNSKSGIPILKDIPILGGLFSSTGKKNKRVELVVLMRPTVLKTPEVAAKTAEIETQKLPGIRAAEREYEADRERRLRKDGPENRPSSLK